MKRRNLDTMREVRLWIRDIIVPAVGIVAFVPELRKAAVEKGKDLKDKVASKFKK